MSEEFRNIDKLFKQGLKGYKQPSPVNAWSRLNENLTRLAARKKIVYFRWIAAAALIFLAFGSGYFFGIYEVSNKKNFTESNYESIINPTPESIESPDQISQPELANDPSAQTFSSPFVLPIPEKIIVQNIGSDFIIDDNIETAMDVSEVRSDNQLPLITMLHVKYLAINNNNVHFFGDQKMRNPKQDAELLKENILAQNTYLTGDFDYNDQVKEEPKWSLGAQFAPVVSYRDISISYEYGQPGNISDTESELNDIEDPLISYAGGVDVNYDVSNRWSLQSGMYFSRIGQVNNEALNFKQENNQFLLFAINTSTGDISISFEKIPDHVKQFESQKKDTIQSINLDNVKVVQNFDLFEIPFLVKYRILDKKFGISLSGGLSPAYLLQNSTILEVDNDKYDIGNSANLNTLIVNTSFGLGFNYAVSRKISLNLEPTFKYSLSPINKNSQFNYHPYYFSWFTGIRYRF
jgi:hypothetical protein